MASYRDLPQTKSPLDAIEKALGLVSTVYGMKVNAAALEKAKADMALKAEEDDRNRRGLYTQKEADAYRKDFDAAQEGEAGAHSIQIQGPGGEIRKEFLKRKSAEVKPDHFGQKEQADFVSKGGKIVAAGTPGAHSVLALGPDGKPRQVGLIPPPKEAKADKEPAQNQYLAATYGREARMADEALGLLLNEGFDPTTAKSGLLGLAPEAVKPEAEKRFAQAKRNFINAVLRRRSGATITPVEMAQGDSQWFPKPGDGPETLAQKAANRAQSIASLEAEAGPALAKVPAIKLELPKKQPKASGLIPAANAAPGADPEMEEYLRLKAKYKPGK